MIINLDARSALVTGSTSGIGFAIAFWLARAGASVTINGRSDASVAAAVERLGDTLPQADVKGVTADAATTDGIAELLESCPEVDILVNNVGVYENKEFLDLTDVDWNRLFEVNVMSGVRLARAYIAKMMSREWGRIIFISSESALHIPTEMIHYGVTKTAQLAVSRGLAEFAAGTGVTVNSILPGPTRTENLSEMLEGVAKQNNESVGQIEAGFIAEMRPTSLIQRFATPEEVANLVVYTASTQASATTGAALRVDGGIVRTVS